jgi:hypothetical protein
VVSPVTQRTDWDCGLFGKIPCVRIEMVVGLERCPEYGRGCGWYPVYDVGMWMAWKGTSCIECKCG